MWWLLLALLVGCAPSKKESPEARARCDANLKAVLAQLKVAYDRSSQNWNGLLVGGPNGLRYQLGREGGLQEGQFRCPLDPSPGKESSYRLNVAAFEQFQPPRWQLVDAKLPLLVEHAAFHEGKAHAISESGQLLELSADELARCRWELPK